jgi:hypothetical protein
MDLHQFTVASDGDSATEILCGKCPPERNIVASSHGMLNRSKQLPNPITPVRAARRGLPAPRGVPPAHQGPGSGPTRPIAQARAVGCGEEHHSPARGRAQGRHGGLPACRAAGKTLRVAADADAWWDELPPSRRSQVHGWLTRAGQTNDRCWGNCPCSGPQACPFYCATMDVKSVKRMTTRSTTSKLVEQPACGRFDRRGIKWH